VIPHGAVTGFATTSALLRDKYLSLDTPVQAKETLSRENKRSRSESKTAVLDDANYGHTSHTKQPCGSANGVEVRKSPARCAMVQAAPKDSSTAINEPLDASAFEILGSSGVKNNVRKQELVENTSTKGKAATKQSKVKNTRVRKVVSGDKKKTVSVGSDISTDTEEVSKYFPALSNSNRAGIPPISTKGNNGVNTSQLPCSFETLSKPQNFPTDLCLDTATIRGSSRTPVKNAPQAKLHASPSQIFLPEMSETVCKNPDVEDRLASLTCGSNACGPSHHDIPRIFSGEALSKRRKIDTIKTPAVQIQALDVQPDVIAHVKSPKKRPITITELATKAYRQPEFLPTAFSTNFVRQINTVETNRDAAGVADEISLPVQRGTSKKRNTSPPKKTKKSKDGTNKPKRAAKPKFVAPKITSPETARRRVEQQNVLFGTSSQLALPESPSYIRTLQQSMQHAERQHDSEPHTDDSLPVSKSIRFAGKRGSRSLWTAAARDLENDLLVPTQKFPTPDRVDDSLSVLAEKSITTHKPSKQRAETSRESDIGVPREIPESPLDAVENIMTFQEEPFVILISSSPHARSDSDCTLPHHSPEDMDKSGGSVKQVGHKIDDSFILPICTSSPITGLDEPSLPQNAEDVIHPHISNSRAFSVNRPLTKTVLQPLPPNLGINRAVLTGTSTPVKSSMALSNFHTLTAEPPPSAQRPTPNPPPAKRTRGRPRKDVSSSVQMAPMSATDKPKGRSHGRIPLAADAQPVKKRGRAQVNGTRTVSPMPVAVQAPLLSRKNANADQWVNIDEIEDSEPDLTPSPPRIRTQGSQGLDLSHSRTSRSNPKDKKDTPLAAKGDLLMSKNEADQQSWAAICDTVFKNITAVVKSQPPSIGSSQLSWHEKILIYDPIILEEFTDWLKQQGVKAIGWRGRKKENMKKNKEVIVSTKSKRRKAKGGIDVEAAEERIERSATNSIETEVEPELDTWMVQKWCEEMSICCLSLNSAWRSKRR
jgi:hypothetical protein